MVALMSSPDPSVFGNGRSATSVIGQIPNQHWQRLSKHLQAVFFPDHKGQNVSGFEAAGTAKAGWPQVSK
jgi:hypothetical protein